MEITRYEFEVLAFLEREGEFEFSLRVLSDTLQISGSKISGTIESLAQNGLIDLNNNILKISEKGLSALSPYRVKRAVILAAGFGSRMVPATLERPKPMVTVKGVRIIDTLLDALVSVGIEDITIVRGYKKEKFDELYEKYPFIKFIDNDIYDKTNNISSAMLVRDKLKNCYLCESDLYISNPGIIRKYQYCSNILGSYSLETDDWSFKMDKGYITEYKKGNTYCYNYYGISYWNSEDGDKLSHDFTEVFEKEDGKDYFWEFIPLVLKHDNYKVEIRQCSKTDIMEIDNFYELVLLDSSYKEMEK